MVEICAGNFTVVVLLCNSILGSVRALLNAAIQEHYQRPLGRGEGEGASFRGLVRGRCCSSIRRTGWMVRWKRGVESVAHLSLLKLHKHRAREISIVLISSTLDLLHNSGT